VGNEIAPRRGLLLWGHHPNNPRLEILDKGRIEEGQQVSWVISGKGLHLVASCPETNTESWIAPNGLGSVTPRPNVWPAQVIELRSLGEVRLCRLRVDLPEPQEVTLTFTSMNHPSVNLVAGATLGLQVDSRQIHVMPARAR
jgi:hypothetical protein